MKKDPIVQRVADKLLQRSAVGIEKYGTTLEENNIDNFLQHIQEELLDAANYVEKVKSGMPTSFGDIINEVARFNESFNVSYNTKPTFDIADKTLRHNLMQEENNEYLDATDIVEVADALGDQLYILVGTILKHGLQNVIVDVFNEIHGSNMSKLQDGKPIYREDGKILKGDKYYKPNLEKFF